MKKIPIILLFLMIVACTQNEFEKYMRKGKDSLQSGVYSEAVRYFDLALIESPSDKDAQILHERSKKELNLQKSKETLPVYQDENSKIYADYTKIILEVKFSAAEELITAAEFERLKGLDDIYQRAKEIGRKYNNYDEIAVAHNYFVEAIFYYKSAFEEISKKGSALKVKQYMAHHDEKIQKYKDAILALQ